ncbi:DUF4249 domain-containing protein [Hymenobacter negativus]|uniref:DUF4249 domain-containing protein n=1 Tax=Hymenobacter negativus TaxID=2795026 RepID=A0ABS3QAQ5_9BACT|nr:DUF4249 domain-containing protein [Hymenobacter negativus]MBO2008339.1 DUF4249 domain-containing protein [Hymenobacter negativus]
MRTFTFPVRWAFLSVLALWLAGCTDPYMPDVITSPPSYLVVDGFINSQGVTTIKLSRTYAVASKAAVPVETRATVYIEDEAGTRQLLTESSVKGTYASVAHTLNTARKYRLHINTLAGREYVSDYVPVKTTPPIDSLPWRTDNNGLSIYVNAHDATNATQYYRWEYVETWEINPIYRPSVEYVNNRMRDIVVPYPSICWGNAASTIIQIDKTTALTQDIVSDFRLRLLPINSDLLNSQYSILVQQYALTREEYAYWELLRKNTESIGSLFDPQPAQLTGNVHCISSPDEITLGFIGAHSLSQRRIFIRRQDLPANWRPRTGYESCMPPDSVFIDRPAPPPPNPAFILQGAFAGGAFLPIEELYSQRGVLIGYTAKSKDCIDCRTRGTSVKPSFWP